MLVVRKERIDLSDECPPAYQTSIRNPTYTAPPPDIRPCNYISITRNVLTGAFVVDPTLRMPAALRSGYVTLANLNKRNLYLRSSGSADVDIYLLASGKPVMTSSNKIKITTLLVETSSDAVMRLVSALRSHVWSILGCNSRVI